MIGRVNYLINEFINRDEDDNDEYGDEDHHHHHHERLE
jgi:hypothetical protein